MPATPTEQNTENFSVVATYIQDLLAETESLQLTDVFYGDQELIPRTPAACVESGLYSRQYAGVPLRTENEIIVNILVYFAKIQDVQVTRLQCDQKAEDIMRVLHANVTMGGLVINGWVSSIEPGYSMRNKVLMRSARITWTGKTKTMVA